jgi:long-chain fatty acid transport protein
MKKSILFAALILTCAQALFATDGTRMIGFNALTMGRGGATIGVFDNAGLMMSNPAGISFLKESVLDGSFSLMIPGVHFANGVNDVSGKTNYFPLPDIGYVHHYEGSDITWGVGAFTQGGMGADFMLNHNLFRNADGSYAQQQYHSKLAVMQGGVSASYRLSPQFSVGVSAHLVYGQMEFSMPYSLAPSIMKGVINPATGMTFGDMFSGPQSAGGFGYTEVTAAADMSGLTAFGFSGKIGIAYRLNDNFTVGATYTSPSALTFKNGRAKMDMTAQLNNAFGLAVQGYIAHNPGATQTQAQQAVMAQFGGLGIDLSKGVAASYDLEAKMKFPQSFGVGLGYKVAQNLQFALDVEWVNWKNAFDKMGLALSNGDNANVNRMLGNSGNVGLDFPLNWKDSYSIRLGLEYAASAPLTLRAGYAYGSNPVPESTIFPVFPAVVENHVMIGASYRLIEVLSLNAAYELALNNSETASSQSMLAQEYNNSVSQLSESIFHLSVTWLLR